MTNLSSSSDSGHGHKSRKDDLAIIIGAGAGGLAAAAAIAPCFSRVLILEKDSAPDPASPRKGVPQGGHVHSLLLGGLDLLERFFPGIRQQFVDRGAVPLRAGLDQKIFEYGEWLPERDLGMLTLGLSRPLLESTLYRMTVAIPNVEILHNTVVRELLLNDRHCLAGVRFEGEKKAEGKYSDLQSSFIVDASGLSGYFVKQLAKLQLGPELVDTIESKVAYASAVLRKPPEWCDSKENILIMPEPSHAAGGTLSDIENDCWCVSLHGRNDMVPPDDLESWKAYARDALPDTGIWERVRHATLVGEIRRFRKPTSIWRRFDQAKVIPDGYFPLGDTIASLNPIFGQGMTQAFGHAFLLRQALIREGVGQERTGRQGMDQQAYIREASEWTRKAWKRVQAYESSFATSQEDASKAVLFRKLALARHQSITRDPSAHRSLIMQGQMVMEAEQ